MLLKICQVLTRNGGVMYELEQRHAQRSQEVTRGDETEILTKQTTPSNPI